ERGRAERAEHGRRRGGDRRDGHPGVLRDRLRARPRVPV
ncbi:MAG: High-affinity branched-chain amino acid transport system permease protein LivH, partial [uncultured Solirubrobacteraceae bacterium]